MRVQPDQFHSVGRRGPFHGRLGQAGRHREAELGVVLAGGHELVGVGLHSRGNPQQDLRPGPGPGGQVVEAVQFVKRVDDDPAHALIQGHG